MDDHLLTFLVLFLLLSIGGIALIYIGLSGIRKARRQAERERARATGSVVNMTKRVSLGRGKPLISWHPVVEFKVDGQTLCHECRTGYWLNQLKVGDRIDILYDVDDPSQYHFEELSEAEATSNRITVIIGIVWIVAAGIIAFIVSQ